MFDDTTSNNQLNNAASIIVANAAPAVSAVVLNAESTASIVVKNLGTGADKVTAAVVTEVDNLANNLDNKIDNTLNNSVENTKITQAMDVFFGKVVLSIENILTKFSSASQTTVDNIIEKSSLPAAVKSELITDVNKGIISASSAAKGEIEKLEDEAESLFNKDFPILEQKLAAFLKGLIAKVKSFADTTITNCKSDIDKFGDKIKSLFSHHNDMSEEMIQEEGDMQFIAELPVISFVGDSNELNSDIVIS